MGLDSRKEDVHEFFVKLMEHFENDDRLTAENFKLLAILNIQLRSTTNYQQCLHSYDVDDYLWQLSLHFPPPLNEDAASSSTTLKISYLLQKFFQHEIINEASCPECGVVGQTVKTLSIKNAPHVFVLHLSRFHGGLDKIDSHVEFDTEFQTHYVTDEHGQEVIYRLTGLILHTGVSIAAGHYTSYFLDQGKWFECNDMEIREVSWHDVSKLRIYILFYQRL